MKPLDSDEEEAEQLGDYQKELRRKSVFCKVKFESYFSKSTANLAK